MVMMPHNFFPIDQSLIVLFFLHCFQVNQYQTQFLFHFIQSINHDHCSLWRACYVHLTYIITFILYCHHKNSGDGGINILTLKIRKLRAGEVQQHATHTPALPDPKGQYEVLSPLFHKLHCVPLATSMTFELINVFFNAYLTIFTYPH